jgi:hypothetical protein
VKVGICLKRRRFLADFFSFEDKPQIDAGTEASSFFGLVRKVAAGELEFGVAGVWDTIKDFIVKTVKEHGDMSYEKLNDLALEQLTDFDGKVNWYIVTVKLDLEARGILERIPKTSPHRIRLCDVD